MRIPVLAFIITIAALSTTQARPTYEQIAASPHLWDLYGFNEYDQYPTVKDRILGLRDFYGSEKAFQELPRSCFVDPCTWEYSEMDRLMKLGLKTDDPAESGRIARQLRDLIAVTEIKEKRNKEVQ